MFYTVSYYLCVIYMHAMKAGFSSMFRRVGLDS